MKLDKKDKLLLYHLDKNARLSYSQLANLTNISQETVRYRLKQLEQEGVIKKYLGIINSARLGFSAYEIMLKFQNINEEKKQKVINSLSSNMSINWIANLEGEYDIAFIILIKNQGELKDLLNKLYSLFGDKIIKKTISVLVSSQFFPRDYLLEKKRETSKEISFGLPQQTIELDDKDKKLCAALSENGRYSYVDLSEKLNLSTDAIANRMKKLSKEKIFTNSTIIIDNSRINQMHYKILLYLNNLSEEKLTELLKHAKQNNRVIAIVKTLAEWDYEIDIEVETLDQLKNFTMELTSKFSPLIKDYSSIRITDMPKYTLYS